MIYKGESSQGRVLRNYQTIKIDPSREAMSTSKLRERSKDLFRNNLICHGIVDTITQGAIGGGLKLQSKIDYKFLKINKDEANKISHFIERSWKIHSGNFDFYGNGSLGVIANTFFRSYLNDGEFFYSIVWQKEGLKIKGLDADFVENEDSFSENIFSGIEVDVFHRPQKIHYYVLEKGEKVYKSINIFKKSGERNLYHVFVPFRSGQLRGIPLISPVLHTLKSVDQFLDNELAASVIASLFSVFIKSPKNDYYDDETNEKDNSPLQLGEGTIGELGEGEDITVAESKRPAPSFSDFINQITKLISSSVGLPPEVLLKSYNSNYSASRAAILDAWELYETQRRFFAENFYQKIYEEFLAYLILTNQLKLSGYFDNNLIKQAWSGANWIGRSRPHIDPYKEAKALEVLVNNHFKTKKKIIEEREGEDFDDVIRQREEEVTKEREAGLISAKEEF